MNRFERLAVDVKLLIDAFGGAFLTVDRWADSLDDEAGPGLRAPLARVRDALRALQGDAEKLLEALGEAKEVDCGR